MLRSLRMVSHSFSCRDEAIPGQNGLLGTGTTSVLREQPVPPLPLNHDPCSSNPSPRKCSSLLVPGDRRSRSSSLALPLTSLCSETSHGTKSAKNSPHGRRRPSHLGLHRIAVRNRLNRSYGLR